MVALPGLLSETYLFTFQRFFFYSYALLFFFHLSDLYGSFSQKLKSIEKQKLV